MMEYFGIYSEKKELTRREDYEDGNHVTEDLDEEEEHLLLKTEENRQKRSLRSLS